MNPEPAVGTFGPADLSVIVPTLGRWDILRRTVDALDAQSVHGFEVVVVVDGDDAGEAPPWLQHHRVIHQPHAGPGAARNRAAASVDRPLILFLGDDMVPTPGVVAEHLRVHRSHPGRSVGVLGRVQWHPDIAGSRLLSWLDWSGTQFDYATLDATGGDDAGWGRFYSCNVSLKRDFFLDARGFDEAFVFHYEDLDAGWRLNEAGLDLRYAPAAIAHHLHSYAWSDVVGRFRGIAVGERAMAERHGWFEPFFRARIERALQASRVGRGWGLLADKVPEALPGLPELRRRVRAKADLAYHQRLAEPFLDAWEADRGLSELREYLGDAFDEQRLNNHVLEVEQEEEAAPDDDTFYRTSQAYLYDLTAFALTGTKVPYREVLRRHVQPPARVLDYGCGIGADGLVLLEQGYEVGFADYANPSTEFLRQRLKDRNSSAPVFDVEDRVPGGWDAVICFDVIEHVEDPVAFLTRLEGLARLVVVNFLEPVPGDTHVHKPLNIAALLDRVTRFELRHYGLYHGRSHLVAYEPRSATGAARLRSLAVRHGAGLRSAVRSRLPNI